MDEIGEEISNKILDALPGPSNSSSEHVFTDEEQSFMDMNSPFFNDSVPLNKDSDPFHIHEPESNCCQKMLWYPYNDGAFKLWDSLVFLPNALFLLFLICRFSSAREKLRATNSPVFRAFYWLVFAASCVCVVRDLFNFIFNAATPIGKETDKILWLLARFSLLAIEISVLVFGLGAGHLDSKQGIRRILIISTVVASAFSMIQTILELGYPDDRFTVFINHERIELFGHGGMLFWLLSSMVFAMIYGLVLILPFLPCRHSFTLPHKRAFYCYAGYMMTLNFIQSVGCGLALDGIVGGLCVVNFTTYLYFTTYAPLVYFAFLKSFFQVAQPQLLFSYKAHVRVKYQF